jgi:hypothetical protein
MRRETQTPMPNCNAMYPMIANSVGVMASG